MLSLVLCSLALLTVSRCACWKQDYLLMCLRIVKLWLSCVGMVLILIPELCVPFDHIEQVIGWYSVRVRESAVLFIVY